MELIDTIVSFITPMGGSIGGLRLSGPLSLNVLQRIFTPVTKKKNSAWEPRKAYFGKLYSGDSLIDEGIAIYFKGPNSYTGEDVVEIFFHGNPFIGNKILESILSSGVRLAERGEFTKRAFYNGKLDLIQAEAVSSLYQVKNEKALELVLRNLEGKFSEILKEIKEKIIRILATIESYLDFPELEFEVTPEFLNSEIHEVKGLIQKILSAYKPGKTIYEGFRVSLVGMVNSGKSSLLNALLEEDKAIITPIPGTTRDIVEGEIQIEGLHYKLYDLAGIRVTSDQIERVGIRKALKKAKESDLLLVVIDLTKKDHPLNQKILQRVKKYKHLVVYNKIDLLEVEPGKEADNEVYISALKRIGLENLKEKIFLKTGAQELSFNQQLFIIGERHKNALELANSSLLRCLESLELGYSYDCLTVDLHESLYHLQELIGEVTSEDILDDLFSTFCIGK